MEWSAMMDAPFSLVCDVWYNVNRFILARGHRKRQCDRKGLHFMLMLTYYGHSCLLLDDGAHKVLTDPFLTGNPTAAITADAVAADTILLSHAHGDHFGDAQAIAERTGAEVVGVPEVLGLLRLPGAKLHGMNLGGTLVLAGDTAIFSDMKFLGERDAIDYALLPIGDNYTMGPEDAALAAKWLGAKHVIPIHYNTWPIIAQDPEEFKKLCEAASDAKVSIVKPGASLELA